MSIACLFAFKTKNQALISHGRPISHKVFIGQIKFIVE